MDSAQKRVIELGGTAVAYVMKTSGRARKLRVTIKPGGAMVVTRPRLLGEPIVEDFLRQKSEWIVKTIGRFKKTKPGLFCGTGKKDFKKYKNAALELVLDKISKFNAIYNFSCGRVSIRNQCSRWGSCSRQGNLNFNFRIALLPDHLADYIVVHELCHLKELNHSNKFWELVGQAQPNYRRLRRELRII